MGIIGAGAVGIALARALTSIGLPLVLMGIRRPTMLPPEMQAIPLGTPTEVAQRARLIFLTVPDSAILPTAQSLPWQAGQWVVHCAGSYPADLLTAAVAPALAGAFHPLAAFTRPDQVRHFPSPSANEEQGSRGATGGVKGWGHPVIALDGPPEVVAGLHALAERLGGRPLVVDAAARPAYHVAASLASNALVALVAEAVDVWHAAGLPAELALPALLPLIASTQANLATVGLPEALTGPIARGDVGTVARHLAVLEGDPALAEIAISYRALGLRAVALARAMGRAEPTALEQIEALLRMPTLPSPEGIGP